MFNLYNPYYFYTRIPDINLYPPTLYSLLESIVNYGKDDKTKIKDLAKVGRTEIFDFDYPLTERITKEDFETHILNHYLMRRIGYETLTAFKIQLNCKINEVIPIFNRMIDSIDDWNIFADDITTRIGNDKTISSSNNVEQNNVDSEINTENTGETKNKNSDLPQSHLENLENNSYVTNYSIDNTKNNGINISKSNGNSTSNTNSNDNKDYQETITHSPSAIEKIEIIEKIQNNIQNIYNIIYKTLDDLFYGIV